ncbi:putative cytochrome P450 6a23 like protein [Argiope bruennichi]|uniref:Putative cytochrome P450 6a23 like protein n=1 Tax=Argiope bruennichi TaxID=94029 RepID=A0A8T0G757_ARGBR|nr:putative cytochrome P450 6a23 like protein [Argiope bruennichi]
MAKEFPPKLIDVFGFQQAVKGGFGFTGHNTLFYLAGKQGVHHELKKDCQHFSFIPEENEVTAVGFGSNNLLAIAVKGQKPLVSIFNMKTNEKRTLTCANKVVRIYGAFTMDLIASAAFSTKIDSHNDPENEFASTAKKAFRRDFTWKNLVLLVFPQLRTLLRIPGFQPFAFNFFYDVSLKIIEERKKTGERGNDFLPAADGHCERTVRRSKFGNSSQGKDTEDIAVLRRISADHHVFRTDASAHLFFRRLESVSTALSMATYMLLCTRMSQEKVHADLVKIVEENNGELTFDGVQSAKYLDIHHTETLRSFPPILRNRGRRSSRLQAGHNGINPTAKNGDFCTHIRHAQRSGVLSGAQKS